MRGDLRGEDFAVSLDQERHDLAREAQQVADDAVEASPERAVDVRLDLLIDARDALNAANRAARRARDWHRVAYAAYRAAVDAEARS